MAISINNDNLSAVKFYSGGTLLEVSVLMYKPSPSDEPIKIWPLGLDKSKLMTITYVDDSQQEVLCENGVATASLVNNALTESSKTRSSIKEVSFGDTINKVDTGAFSGCTSLTTIEQNNIYELGASAFSGCTSLNDIGEMKLGTSNANVFTDCQALTSVTIATTSIGKEAFKGCSNLTALNVDSSTSVTSIGESAFSGCTKLKSSEVDKLNNVSSIGAYAFASCKALTNVTTPSVSTYSTIASGTYQDCTSLTSLTISNNVKTIGPNAFSGCTSLPSSAITSLSSSINNVQKYAFANCTSLTTIMIPTTTAYTTIAEGLYQNCTSLTSIGIGDNEIPSHIKTIGSNAFSGCSGSSFTELNIPDNVNAVSANAFSNCTSVTNVRIGSGVTAATETSFKVNSRNVSSLAIDSQTILSKPMSSYSFAYTWLGNTISTALTTVSIGTKCTTIGNKFFYNEKGLSKLNGSNGNENGINIPSNITKIGVQSFYGCSGFTALTLVNGLGNIGNYAFEQCTNTGFTAVTIPETVSSIGINPFKSDNNLEHIDVASGNTTYHSFNQSCIHTNSKKVIFGCKLTVFEDYEHDEVGYTQSTPITCIGQESFYEIGDSTFSGVFNDSLIEIETKAFYHSFLTSVSIGTRLTTIGSEAFCLCSKISGMTVSGSNVNFSSYDDADAILTKDNTKVIYGCNNSNLANKDSIITIGQHAFHGNTGITSITIPDNVTTIETAAFSGCTKLNTVTIPNKVKSIGDYAYSYCTSFTSLIIPNSVEILGGRAFDNCHSLTTVTIGNGFANLSGTFSNCLKLKEVNFNENSKVTSFATFVAYGTFEGCSSLTSITIPDSVTSIGNYAFNGCSSLTSITIPDSVTSIGSLAFNSCSSLTSIEIPNSITSISDSALRYCSSLTSVTIPNSVTTIGYSAFNGCSSLTSITIPDSVTNISANAFSSCTSLIKYDFGNTRATVVSIVTTSLQINANTKIYVPNAYIDKWKTDTHFKEYADIIVQSV